jgi:hypothetical protein
MSGTRSSRTEGSESPSSSVEEKGSQNIGRGSTDDDNKTTKSVRKECRMPTTTKWMGDPLSTLYVVINAPKDPDRSASEIERDDAKFYACLSRVLECIYDAKRAATEGRYPCKEAVAIVLVNCDSEGYARKAYSYYDTLEKARNGGGKSGGFDFFAAYRNSSCAKSVKVGNEGDFCCVKLETHWWRKTVLSRPRSKDPDRDVMDVMIDNASGGTISERSRVVPSVLTFTGCVIELDFMTLLDYEDFREIAVRMRDLSLGASESGKDRLCETLIRTPDSETLRTSENLLSRMKNDLIVRSATFNGFEGESEGRFYKLHVQETCTKFENYGERATSCEGWAKKTVFPFSSYASNFESVKNRYAMPKFEASSSKRNLTREERSIETDRNVEGALLHSRKYRNDAASFILFVVTFSCIAASFDSKKTVPLPTVAFFSAAYFLCLWSVWSATMTSSVFAIAKKPNSSSLKAAFSCAMHPLFGWVVALFSFAERAKRSFSKYRSRYSSKKSSLSETKEKKSKERKRVSEALFSEFDVVETDDEEIEPVCSCSGLASLVVNVVTFWGRIAFFGCWFFCCFKKRKFCKRRCCCAFNFLSCGCCRRGKKGKKTTTTTTENGCVVLGFVSPLSSDSKIEEVASLEWDLGRKVRYHRIGRSYRGSNA